MTWSTRELADLAGTTMNTVRHYHALGLLPEPDRSYNGYKHYKTHHLVRLLRLRRLVELGLPLAQVGMSGESEAKDALRHTDTVLQEKIDRFERSRRDIAEILRAGAPADTARGFESIGARLTESDHSLLHICVHTHPPASFSRLRLMVEAESSDVQDQIRALTPQSSVETKNHLAERLALSGAHWRSTVWLENFASSAYSSRLSRGGQETFAEAIDALYEPAQRSVFRQADLRLRGHQQIAPTEQIFRT